MIAVTGTNGKSTIVKLTSRIFQSAGYRVGYCCTDGVFCDGRLTVAGDQIGAGGAWRAAHCPDADLLIFEVGRGGLLDYGPGFRGCHVGVITNVHEDHLGFHSVHTKEEMAVVKSVVVERIFREGTAVLNGDDPLVMNMGSRIRGEVIYFTAEGDPDRFDKCFYYRYGHIWLKEGASREKIIGVRQIPMTLGGALRCNIVNAMAALAAVQGLQGRLSVPRENIIRTLREFGRTPYDNVDRFNLVQYRGELVLLCRSKGPESYKENLAVIRMLQKAFGIDHTIGLLTAPGNRREDLYLKISALVAPVADVFYVRPPDKQYLRSRPGPEIVRLLSLNLPEGKVRTEDLSLEKIIMKEGGGASGRCFFIVFNAAGEANIDPLTVLDESEHLTVDLGGGINLLHGFRFPGCLPPG